jgi:hypothetical protein
VEQVRLRQDPHGNGPLDRRQRVIERTPKIFVVRHQPWGFAGTLEKPAQRGGPIAQRRM